MAAETRTPVSASMLSLVVAALVGVHLLDDNFVHPEPGTTPGDHLVSGLVPLAALALTTAVAVRTRPGAQAIAAGIIGASAVIAGVEGWQSLRSAGPSGDDYTGILALPAGVILLVSTGVHVWRTRRRDGRRTRRYLRRGLIAVAGLLLALQVGYPMANAYLGTHRSSPRPSGADLGLAYEEVEIAADGGAVLRAWYRALPQPRRGDHLPRAAECAAVRALPGRPRIRRADGRPPRPRRQHRRPQLLRLG